MSAMSSPHFTSLICISSWGYCYWLKAQGFPEGEIDAICEMKLQMSNLHICRFAMSWVCKREKSNYELCVLTWSTSGRHQKTFKMCLYKSFFMAYRSTGSIKPMDSRQEIWPQLQQGDYPTSSWIALGAGVSWYKMVCFSDQFCWRFMVTSPGGIPFRVILGRREASKEYTDYGSTHFLQPLDEVGKIVKQEYNLGVSKNSCTPKSSILIGFFIINHPFCGYPYF